MPSGALRRAAPSASRPSPSRSRTTTTGAPFPTTYYLTCRHLIAAVSRLEAAGGVERWSADGRGEPGADRRPRRATAEQRRIRRALAAGRTAPTAAPRSTPASAGSRNPAQLKCLHAHVAFALAQPGYRIGELILAEVPERWPAEPAALPMERRRRERSTSTAPGATGRTGYRRFELASRDDGSRRSASASQFDVISAELRRRVGGTFTLAMLAACYAGSDAWARQAIEEQAPTPGWARIGRDGRRRRVSRLRARRGGLHAVSETRAATATGDRRDPRRRWPRRARRGRRSCSSSSRSGSRSARR